MYLGLTEQFACALPRHAARSAGNGALRAGCCSDAVRGVRVAAAMQHAVRVLLRAARARETYRPALSAARSAWVAVTMWRAARV